MKINTIRQNKEEKKANQNLMWISAEIPPLKPDNASRYMRYKTYPVIVDYQYNDGCVGEVLDFCDYDLKKRNGNWISLIKLDSISHFQASTK